VFAGRLWPALEGACGAIAPSPVRVGDWRPETIAAWKGLFGSIFNVDSLKLYPADPGAFPTALADRLNAQCAVAACQRLEPESGFRFVPGSGWEAFGAGSDPGGCLAAPDAYEAQREACGNPVLRYYCDGSADCKPCSLFTCPPGATTFASQLDCLCVACAAPIAPVSLAAPAAPATPGPLAATSSSAGRGARARARGGGARTALVASIIVLVVLSVGLLTGAIVYSVSRA
jgi:hypothetical protein